MAVKFVTPKVFLIGYTEVDYKGLKEYLTYTNQTEFLRSWEEAISQGLSTAECLCSFFAKLCYKSLVPGKNDNISKVRDIPDNIKSIHDTAHGSVLEHCGINFVATDVSRVLTHEMVRHRAGWAYSQTSGRYVRASDRLDFISDPILDEVKEEINDLLHQIVFCYQNIEEKLKLDELRDFSHKKKLTSALRRILPNGQANEIGFSVNLRALRHFVMIRTSRHAEWEIRAVAEQVYELVKAKFPLIFYGAKEEVVGGVKEITGMKLQPYEKESLGA